MKPKQTAVSRKPKGKTLHTEGYVDKHVVGMLLDIAHSTNAIIDAHDGKHSAEDYHRVVNYHLYEVLCKVLELHEATVGKHEPSLIAQLRAHEQSTASRLLEQADLSTRVLGLRPIKWK